jgi:hypothetical protein
MRGNQPRGEADMVDVRMSEDGVIHCRALVWITRWI